MPGKSPPKPACVEDENPVTGDGDPKTRMSASSRVGTRGDKPLSSIRQGKSSSPSDSAVSGLSQVSRGSGGSGQAKLAPRPSRQSEDVAALPRRRSTVSEKVRPKDAHRETRRRSPEKTSRRRDSRVQPADPVQDGVCDSPDCLDCQSTSTRRKQRPSPLETGMDLNYSPFTGPDYPDRSLGTDRPPQSAYPRTNVPSNQTIGSRPRGLSATRPVSFAGYSMSGGMAPPTTAPHLGMPQGYPMHGSVHEQYQSPYLNGHMLTRPDFRPKPDMPSVAGSPGRTNAMGRPGPVHSVTVDGLDYSARAPTQAHTQIPTYSLSQRSEARTADDFDITTRPGSLGRHNSIRGVPGTYPSSDSSESSLERPFLTSRPSDRDMMPPPSAPISHRPSMRHAATTPETLPRRLDTYQNSAGPIIYQQPLAPLAYDSPMDQYDTDRTDRAVIAQSRPRRESGSRQSERSYMTYASDPLNGRSQRKNIVPARRSSIQGQKGLRQQEEEVMRYQDNIRGFKDSPMTAEWLRDEKRRSITSGRTSSHVSHGSHRSHKSRQSISSHVSAKDGMVVQFGGTVVDVGEGHSVSLEPGPEGGRARLVIEDGRGYEKGYRTEDSVRSSAQASSGTRSHRSRAESESSRGRRQSVRPENRRRTDQTGEA